MDYLDASVLYYALHDSGLKGEASRKLVGSGGLVSSSLTLDEIAYPSFKAAPVEAARIVRELSGNSAINFEPFTADMFEQFAALMESGLAPRDSIHAATALKFGCKTIYSEDKDFDKVKGLKRKVPW